MKTITTSILAILGFAAFATAADQPNFILLLSDDQAWNGLSLPMHPDLPGSKSSVYQTPNLEKFAAQGMRFSAAYSPASVCSPTRISLQTGMSPGQLHWTKAAPVMTAADKLKLIPPRSRKSIESDEVTIAELLKTAGYATAHYGKWHLGGGGPESHGYDESDGNTGNQDAAPFKGDNPVDIFGMGKRAGDFMEKCDEAGLPFYIQMSYHALHYPENASPEAVAKFKNAGERGSEHAPIAWDLDRGVGELLEKIDELSLAKNTYVIYMADNGGNAGGGGGGGGGKGGRKGGGTLTASKGSVFEGGIRVPFIVRGPGVPANSWCHERIVGFDFLPTFCALAGVKKNIPETVEGGDISHLFHGKSEAVKRPREELVFHFPHYQGDSPHTAIFHGDYKLIRFYETGETRLYKISSDIGEGSDLAAGMPDKAKALDQRLTLYLEEVAADLPTTNPDHVPGTTYQKKGGGKGGKKPRPDGKKTKQR